MELVHWFRVLWITMTLLTFQYASNVEGIHHYHKRNKNSSPPNTADDPVAPSTPSIAPPTPPRDVPSDPYPNDPGKNSNSSDSAFNVMDYGAVGDGSADDSAGFCFIQLAYVYVALLVLLDGIVLTKIKAVQKIKKIVLDR